MYLNSTSRLSLGSESDAVNAHRSFSMSSGGSIFTALDHLSRTSRMVLNCSLCRSNVSRAESPPPPPIPLAPPPVINDSMSPHPSASFAASRAVLPFFFAACPPWPDNFTVAPAPAPFTGVGNFFPSESREPLAVWSSFSASRCAMIALYLSCSAVLPSRSRGLPLASFMCAR